MFVYDGNIKLFKFGNSDYASSREAANNCNYFKADDEDEQVDSVLKSCYNCIYRRWKSTSFQCMKRL
jgi:hypothetical protein